MLNTDTNYTNNDNHYVLVGYTGSWLHYSKSLAKWELKVRTDTETWCVATFRGQGRDGGWNRYTALFHFRALTNATDYPIGSRGWDIRSPQFNGAVTLNLNACDDEEEYNCADGTCVRIEDRCNGKNDCPDGSDEQNCTVIVVESSYIRDYPAPPADGYNGKARSDIELKIDVMKVMDISEVDSEIGVQYELMMSWKDCRLTFWNLKAESYLNTVSSKDAVKVWYPKLQFYNTKEKDETMVNRIFLRYTQSV